MTDSNPDPIEPRELTMVAALGRKLFPDPAAVAQLCAPLYGPVPADKIGRGAVILKHDRILRELAIRCLEIDAEKSNRAIKAAVRKARADHAAGKLTNKEAWYRAHQDASKCIEQSQPENEAIARFIEAKAHELWAEARAGVRNGKLRVCGTNRETGLRDALSYNELSVRPPSRMAIRENRIGLYEDVTFERVEEPAEEAPAAAAGEPAAVQDNAAPGSRANGAAVQQETEGAQLEEAPAGVATALAADQDGPALVDEWYFRGWVPACVKAGIIPSQEEDEKAAKPVFGSRKIKDMRGILRNARRKYGPDNWTITGPKGLDRKNTKSDPVYLQKLDRAIQESRKFWWEYRGLTPPEF